MHFWKRYESLSPARFHREFLDVARRYQPAVTRAGFEPENMRKPGSTTLRSKVGRTQYGPERERRVSDCPQSRTIPLSHTTLRPLIGVAAGRLHGTSLRRRVIPNIRRLVLHDGIVSPQATIHEPLTTEVERRKKQGAADVTSAAFVVFSLPSSRCTPHHDGPRKILEAHSDRAFAGRFTAVKVSDSSEPLLPRRVPDAAPYCRR